MKRTLIPLIVLAAAVFALACTDDDDDGGGGGLSSSAQEIAEERGLTDADIAAALKTFVPSGQHDEYIMFASGGHSGQVFVIGIPSMRILKTIAVFTPEAWQGYGIGNVATEQTLAGGNYNDQTIRWGDTHHPALSETAGDYDGEFLFINDKAHGRVGVIDLRDFETKQIVKNPFANIDHGGTFVTPDTEWIIEGPQYAHPLGGAYAPLSEYNEQYRGYVMFWKFDREAGRIDESQSFGMELPPYWQDLCDVGKLESAGWLFCGSLNAERATGGVEDGNPAFEVGVSQNDMDYLHVINWEKAAEIGASAPEVNGFPLIDLDTAVAEDLVFLIPEPKSPHGSDVTPGGEYVVVSGKLDPHVTIYAFEQIMDAIDSGAGELDPYGLRILPFDDVMTAQIEVGLGPLHTQFDGDGYAYTSLFLDNAVAKWSLGPPYHDEWELIETVPTQYNVGHIAAAEGDTVAPDGRYLVSLNKWAVDRFANIGPLLPQNLQLVDLTGEAMQVIYDGAMGIGEPHYAQIIKADKLSPWEVYPAGTNPETMAADPNAIVDGEERVERNGNTVEIFMSARRSHFTPENIEINQGDRVIWHITNIEDAYDATHGFALSGHNLHMSIEPGETATIEFVAENSGTFNFYCTEFCSALHLEMMGHLLVAP